MTEAESPGCDNPFTLLAELRGRASDRKLRLFACTLCRRLWPMLSDERSRHAVETAERYADGLAGSGELAAAWAAASQAMVGFDPRPQAHASRSARAQARRDHEATFAAAKTALVPLPGDDFVFHSAGAAASELERLVWLPADLAQTRVDAARGTPGARAARAAARQARLAAGGSVAAARQVAERQESDYNLAVLRDLAGAFPLRPVTIERTLHTRYDSTTVKLARAIYEERAFDRLPVLAVALEEAGCIDTEVLGHLRGPGPHVRGCWVLDLLLGKE